MGKFWKYQVFTTPKFKSHIKITTSKIVVVCLIRQWCKLLGQVYNFIKDRHILFTRCGPIAWHPSVTAHPPLFLRPWKEIIGMELRSIACRSDEVALWLKCAWSAAPNAPNGARGGSTCQRAYRVKSSSWHRSHSHLQHTHKHANQKQLKGRWGESPSVQLSFVVLFYR